MFQASSLIKKHKKPRHRPPPSVAFLLLLINASSMYELCNCIVYADDHVSPLENAWLNLIETKWNIRKKKAMLQRSNN